MLKKRRLNTIERGALALWWVTVLGAGCAVLRAGDRVRKIIGWRCKNDIYMPVMQKKV